MCFISWCIYKEILIELDHEGIPFYRDDRLLYEGDIENVKDILSVNHVRDREYYKTSKWVNIIKNP